MTTDYATPYSPSGAFIYGSGINASAPEPPSPLHWRTFKLPASDPDAEIAIGWELKIDDLRGGYAQYGDFGRGGSQYDGDYRKTSISTLDQRFDRHLLLPPLVTQTEHSASVTASDGAVCHTRFGTANLLAIGIDDNANLSLFGETSSTNPVLSARTYSPGAVITCLSPIIIGGAGTAEQLVVGRAATAAEVLSDLASTPTSTGSMHASTSTMWGNVLSPINAATPGTPTNVFMAGSPASIWTLPSTSAIGAAPTATLTNIPAGGAMLGIEQLQKNFPLRIFAILPIQATSSSMFAAGTDYPGKVISINLEGTDPQDVPLKMRVKAACIWNQTIVATDGVRVVSYDGETLRDLHVLKGRAHNSNYRWGCTSFVVHGNDLYAFITRSDFTVASGEVGAGVLTLERYAPEFDAWIPVSGAITLSNAATGNTSRSAPYGRPDTYMLEAPHHAVSPQSAFVHIFMRSSGKTVSDRFFLSPEGVNPYDHYNMTGSTQYIAQAWATTGTYDSPYLSLPTLEGRIKKADQVVFLGQIDEGNVKITLNPNEGGTALTFAGTDETRAQPVESSDAEFDLLQVRIQLNQGSSTFKTPNGLPIVIRGRAYLTEPVEELTGGYL